MRRAFLAAALSFVVLDSAAAFTRAEAADATLPIQIVNNHLYGEVTVNGQGPFLFILDTAGHNLLTPQTAKLLGLKVQGTMDAGFTKVSKIDIGNTGVSDQTFTVLPLEALSNVEGVDIPGMIGFELFHGFVTRIDYGAKTLTLIDSKAFDPKDAGTPIKFTFNGRAPMIQATFEGTAAKFTIDTGSRAELTLSNSFAERNDLRAKHSRGVDAVDGWGLGGPSRGYVTRASQITLGPIKMSGDVTSLASQDSGDLSIDGTIGGGILKRFVVTFDFAREILYLKPLPQRVTDIGTFDRSGMWLNKVGVGFQIADVTLKGPAQLAGLKIDDVISAVDGKPATGIALYDLRKRLRNDPAGTKVTFTIRRGEKSRDVLLVLRDQI